MWVFTNQAFLSIVSKDCRPDQLLVRARREGDIEKVFPNAVVKQTVGVDYLYRAVVSRAEVASTIANCLYEVDYANYKDSIPYADKELRHACGRVWSVMADMQRIPPYSNTFASTSFALSEQQLGRTKRRVRK